MYLFFQAEDGIRGYDVTGVQTCALPISTTMASGLGPGSYKVVIRDDANCTASDSIVITEPLPGSTIFPNPSTDLTYVYFEMETAGLISISIFNVQGKIIKHLYEDLAKQGSNVFTFSTAPLSLGSYILRVNTREKTIVSQQFIKG